jgi:ribosomal protein S27E
MKTMTKTLLLAGTIGFASLMTSCQSASTDAKSAVTCDKCKTVWVQRPQQVGPTGKGSFYVLKDAKAMACPDCESAVATFFKTGQFQHRCSHCGGALAHCTTH